MVWSGYGYGHVAVVEQVCNAGTDDEYVIISQSYYGGDIGHVTKVSKSSYYNGRPYSFAWGYTFDRFLISPVCQIASASELTIQINVYEPSVQDKNRYIELAKQFAGEQSTITSELSVNSKVLVTWFGNEKPNGTGKRVGNLDAEGVISSIDKSKEYPYGVKVGGKVIGYYQRDALEEGKSGTFPKSEPWTNNSSSNPSSSGGGSSGGGGAPSGDIPDTTPYTGEQTSPTSVDTSLPGKKYIITDAFKGNPDDKLRIRLKPNTSSSVVGHLDAGDQIESYEYQYNGGYEWHRIDTNKWVANVNNCFVENTEQVTVGFKAKVLVQLHVRTSPHLPDTEHGEPDNLVRTLEPDTYVSILEMTDEPDENNIIWNRINEKEWVANQISTFEIEHKEPEDPWCGQYLKYYRDSKTGGLSKFYNIRILVELNVRSGAGKNYNIVRRLNYGDVASAYTKKTIGTITWYQIGANE